MSRVYQKKFHKHPGRPMHARAELVACARELFIEQGLDISLDTIASKAGTTRQTLYNHFTSKTLLLAEALESIQGDLEAPFINAYKHHLALDQRLLEMGRAIQLHFYDPRVIQLQRLLILALVQMPEVLPDWQQRRTGHASAMLTSALAQEQARGTIHIEQPEHAANAFLGAVMGPMYPGVLLGDKVPSAPELERLNQEVCRTFMRAWSAQTSTACAV
ncbi:TetR/AcrR family transcriptional regulator [Lampropedia aestuarii]|uniref:TetR/AcrR family transcriptional regulator n=1 Tax=Lampropedia aestuarii TaxID=2562762 RepID=A0A4V3YXM3_9BURK|nr:TetR/AcrR family transcriptional regulator [Lampropedia aestuarii]THJ35712.1 TetR/AcrR family transcriptional regulator [Lampropedia aestuarii]